MNVDKNELKRVKDFIIKNPDYAREIIKNSPELMNMLNSDNGKSNGKTNEKQLTKSLPGIPKMFDDNGFSNYALLAFVAFFIQFLVTLICIMFYK